jgi:hypothetical protein
VDADVNLDDDDLNADWLQSMVWDVWSDDAPPRLVTSLAQLRAALWNRTDAELKAMLTLPVARAMPEPLKSELQAL